MASVAHQSELYFVWPAGTPPCPFPQETVMLNSFSREASRVKCHSLYVVIPRRFTLRAQHLVTA